MEKRVNKETWKRIVLWILLLASLSFNYMGWSDYNHMDEQMRLMKQGFVEDVVGYGFCDKD